MKRIYLLLLMLLLALAVGCEAQTTESEYISVYENESEDVDLVVENEHLSMVFNTGTTQFSITDKSSGKIWYSNPQGASEDPLAVKSVKETLQSQVLLRYGQSVGANTEFNNYTLSLVNDTYAYEKVENGIKVMYTIGKVEKEIIIPHAMYETRIMEYYNQMDKAEQRLINNYYRIIDINKLLATDNKTEMLEKYPGLADERLFMLRDSIQKHVLERIEELFAKYGYTHEEYEQEMEAGKNDSGKDLPAFNVSVIYQLDGPDLLVTVPLEEIEYKSNFPIVSLTVLPFFGAGGIEDEGFMFVPDGSGGIIRFNNGKQNQNTYINSIYGYDYGLKRTALVSDNGAYFPVFGINNNGSSFICVVEKGSEDGTIEADVSRRVHSYNFVNNRFTIVNGDDIDISKANAYVRIFENKKLTGSFNQRYIFLDSPDYVDMATAYRDYLMRTNPELKKLDENSLPAVLEIIGAIDKTTNVMGVPVSQNEPLTTYKQSTDIVSKLMESGMNNLTVKYAGWFNDGVTHDAPAKVKLVSTLGSKKDFQDMVSFMDSRGVDLYLEADFTYIFDISAFNGYFANNDAARRISRELSNMYMYSFIWYGERKHNTTRLARYYLASPEFTMNSIDSFAENINKLGAKNIAFNSIGYSLNSDFNVKKPVSRAEVMEMHENKLAQLQSSGSKLMVHGGNIYAVPHSNVIIDMELESKRFNIIDESIPFYQIALHGLKTYTGGAMNFMPDYEKNILKTVETGAGLYFSFMNASGGVLPNTNYTRYYAADISKWQNKPADLYNKLNSSLGHTFNKFITGHSKLDSNVTMTEYEDGTRVIVNYDSNAFSFEGREIAARDFLVLKAGE